ncbi:MAG: protease modulator HflC [Deltaproteobacteria bacterium]|nr:protease modulator HflC [Deltaproteobacteria bacterium]
MKSKIFLPIVLIVIIFALLFSSAYIVDETEQVVVTQFGEVVGSPKQSPGIYFKIPFIQYTNYFPKNILSWDGDPGQIPTNDKTYIWVDTFARWKISDPISFFQTVNNRISALGRLDDIIDPAVRNLITSYRLIETVRKSNRVLDTFDEADELNAEKRKGSIHNISTGRDKIIDNIMKQAQPKLEKFGIQLMDVKIKRINYVEEVRQTVYARMIAERKQVAEKFRSEGKGEASKIRGDKERELQKIESEAYKIAQKIKGKADAKAASIYADAYNLDPELYSFIKTLGIYEESLDKSNSLILSTDSEFLKYLKDYPK